MPKKTMPKTETVIPNGTRENINTFESEDEIEKVQKFWKIV